MPHYTAYVMDISYFSGKFEAYLRCKGIPYERIDVDHPRLFEVYRHTGTMKVPALRLDDGRWLKDSTVMIRWLEGRHPEPSVMPRDPVLRFLANLVEDYADEWLWRPAMWWRWMPRDSRYVLGHRIAREVIAGGPPGPVWLKAAFFAWRQRREWLWDDGMTRDNQARIRDMYPQELASLQAILERQPFLLGDRPSIADFGYFASMFRHFGNDPDPARLMRQTAPAVHEWLARLWNGAALQAPDPGGFTLPQGPGWSGIWGRVCTLYLPYLHQNALAFRDRRKRFDFEAAGLRLPRTKTTDYRVWCRQDLQRQLAALDDASRAAVRDFLAPHGGIDALLADGEIDSGLDAELQVPFEPRALQPWWRQAWVWANGNPRQARA
ncbi:MAG TPA: glutathione S-transferase family protein [Candidatus Binatia bacterium]|nr:glutathione S-transferase family protein [Candidatus Binatia bacterium]